MPAFRRVASSLSAAALLAGTLAACSPLATLNLLTPGGGYERSTAQYGSHPRHTLDVYTPLPRPDAAPVVVFFHGGTWNSGDRSGYLFLGEALASRGIVTVIANYRLYPEVRYPAFLEDGAQAVAWTVRHVARHGGSPERLFLMGHSSGAYNAAMLALDARWLGGAGLAPSILSGWIGLAGPYDFLPIQNPAVKPVFFHPETPPSSQPVRHVSADAPPALLIAARDDELVDPERNTGGLSRLLRDAGVTVHERQYGRVGHASLVAALAWPLRWLAPVLDEVNAFVRDAAPLESRVGKPPGAAYGAAQAARPAR